MILTCDWRCKPSNTLLKEVCKDPNVWSLCQIQREKGVFLCMYDLKFDLPTLTVLWLLSGQRAVSKDYEKIKKKSATFIIGLMVSKKDPNRQLQKYIHAAILLQGKAIYVFMFCWLIVKIREKNKDSFTISKQVKTIRCEYLHFTNNLSKVIADIVNHFYNLHITRNYLW